MDLWAKISLGQKWIDDDRYIHEKTKIQQEVMVTTLNTPIKKCRAEFLRAVSEVFDEIMNLNDRIDKDGT